jgi:chemotaxis protein MotB
VRIEGHSDNVTVKLDRFPSNWELSAARAINVARYFIEVHDVQPGMIATTGYAEYRPVASNDTPEGRAKNRRVDIVLMSELESKKEPK